ncbi:hypothetical protein BH10ACI3_BH10ACI3_29540 [soil metagenome]
MKKGMITAGVYSYSQSIDVRQATFVNLLLLRVLRAGPALRLFPKKFVVMV